MKFFVDDRGTFCDLTTGKPFNIKRVYVCENFKQGTIRGCHFHEKEAKLFYVPRGAIKIAIFPFTKKDAEYLSTITDLDSFNGFDTMTKKCKDLIAKIYSSIKVYVLAEKKPNTLCVEPGFVNAWQSLKDDSMLIGCSSSDLEESVKDDIRFDPQLLKKIWKVDDR